MERNYTTQMDAARRGILTPELETVARKEQMRPEELMPLVAEGKVAIPANRLHSCLDAQGIGSMLRTKINVNLGVSRDCKDYDVEMEKVRSAVSMGAEAIMDLSSHGNTQPFRQKLTHECPVMIGTVPVYDSVIHYQRDLATLTAQDFVDVVRLHAEDGVDFVTLHCGITRKTIEQIRKHKRKMNIVSRGGSLVFAWMCMTGNENPFYEHFDEILDICEEHDVTISLGDACRPGCLADATDVCQIDEEKVAIGTLQISSKSLARNLNHCEKAVLFGATLGTGVDRLIARTSLTDMANAVVLQACAAAMLEEFCDEKQFEIGEELEKEGLYLRPRFSPGYGDFDIGFQKSFMQMLDCAKAIGLTMTESFMMTPTKSVTAVIGASRIKERCPIAGCEVCDKKECIYRR